MQEIGFVDAASCAATMEGRLKNVQVVTSAANCPVLVFRVSDEDYGLLFPDGRDLAFEDEAQERISTGGVNFGELVRRIWSAPVDKKTLRGIHGTYYERDACVEPSYFPNFRESDFHDRLG